jgi:putative membrane protein
MILPGVPGSSVLIIMGVYDDAMLALSRLDLTWLLVFGLGAALGIIGLSNLVDRVYARHRNVLGWLFAGLIVGSARLLIMPEGGNILIYLPLAVVGFAVVWLLESRFGSSSSVDDVAGNTNSPSSGD